MKKIIFLILGLSLLAAPDITFAATNLTGYNIFTPPITDLSMNYLGQVFGNVGGVVHGTSGQLLSEIFRVFNYAMVMIASVILIYTIVLSVINTAQEGEFMGRKWNSSWIVFRAVLGIGILVPKYTGYSIIQVFVMWVTVQGIGLADTAWSRAVDYLVNDGGVIYAAPMKANSMQSTLENMEPIFQSEICMYKIQDLQQQDRQTAINNLKKDPSNPSLQWKARQALTRFNPLWNETAKTVSFGYPSDNPETQTACGVYSWRADGDENLENYKKAGLQQTVVTLSGAAKTVADASASNNVVDNNSAPLLGKVSPERAKEATLAGVIGATQDYENILAPALRKAKSDADEKWRENLIKSKDEGWISAGSYYWDLAQINNKLEKTGKDYQFKTDSGINTGAMPENYRQPVNDAVAQGKGYLNMDELVRLLKQLEDRAGESGANFAQISAALYAETQKNGQSWQPPFTKMSDLQGDINRPAFSSDHQNKTLGLMAGATGGMVAATVVTPAIGGMMLILSGSLTALTAIWFAAMNAPGDPLAMVQVLGQSMVGIAVSLWLIGAVFLGTFTAIMSIGTCVTGVGYAVQNALKYFLPVVLTFVGVLFVNGMVLSVYVPLIPFMIFTFAAIGWLISVLEALVASGLVGAAITHPEGHDLLGQAQQAVMLLLGIFLRPVVMIIGFLAAIVLSRVTLRIVNAGFSHTTLASGMTNDGWNIFATAGLMIVYTMIVLGLINLVFNAGIVKLWETIWMWIGAHQPSSGTEQALQEIKSGMHGGLQAGSDLGTGLMKAGGETRVAQAERGDTATHNQSGGFVRGQGLGSNQTNPNGTVGNNHNVQNG